MARDESSTKSLKIDDFEAQNKDLTEKLKSVENRLNAMLAEEASFGGELTREKQMELDLREARSELLSVKDELSQAVNDVEQYKAIAAASEAALNDLSRSFDTYKLSKDQEHEQLSKDSKQNATLSEELKSQLETISLELEKSQSLNQSNVESFERERAMLHERIESLAEVEQEVCAAEYIV